jgi:hypothetical protein
VKRSGDVALRGATVRTFGVWLFGLLASGIFGGMIGNQFFYPDGGFFGLVGGMCTFACVRLWLSPKREMSD